MNRTSSQGTRGRWGVSLRTNEQQKRGEGNKRGSEKFAKALRCVHDDMRIRHGKGIFVFDISSFSPCTIDAVVRTERNKIKQLLQDENQRAYDA